MGSMKFHIPGLAELDSRLLTTAAVVGIEGVPWAGRITSDGDELSILRAIDESGRVQIVWPTVTRGPLMLGTASLRVNDEAYVLPLEIARGSVDRLATRLSEWTRWGIQPPENFFELFANAKRFLVDAIVAKENLSDVALSAQHSIEFALAASRILCQTFSRQLLSNRNKNEGQLSTLQGARLPTHEHWKSVATTLKPMMNTGWVDASWHVIRQSSGRLNLQQIDDQIEWCANASLRVIAGPLVSLQPHAIQDWFFVMDDFQAIVDEACQYAEQVVSRFRGRVNLWNLASGFNSLNELKLNEDQIMLLAVSLLETVRKADPMTPIVFGIDMPFGEYLGVDESGISPLHFADALIRADLGLNGLLLEINYGVWPAGTPMHDALDLSNLLDLWSTLGLPLVLSMSGETKTRLAEKAASKLASDAPIDSKLSVSKYGSIPSWKSSPPAFDPAALKGLVKQSASSQMFEMVALALSKPSVHGVFWNQPDDRTPPNFPFASLVQPDGTATDLLTGMANLKKRHLT